MPYVRNGDRERFAVVARWYTGSTSVTHSPSESEMSSSDEEEDLGSSASLAMEFMKQLVRERTAEVGEKRSRGQVNQRQRSRGD